MGIMHRLFAVLGCLVVALLAPQVAASTDPKYVLVAGPPRMGTTWLFNAVRLLVRYHDPNSISGWSTTLKEKDLCYWKRRNVSMVVKTHALFRSWLIGANCPVGPKNSGETEYIVGFETAVTSFREPYGTACSLIKKDGRVQKDMCEKVICEQHGFYHPPTLAIDGVEITVPRVVYEMDFLDLKAGKIVEILRGLAEAIGIAESLQLDLGDSDAPVAEGEEVERRRLAADDTYRIIARELSMLRPLGDPHHNLRSAHHPVTLMHSNHLGVKDDSLCEASDSLKFMRSNPLCIDLAEQDGRVTDDLYTKHSWKGKCIGVKKPTLPVQKEL